MTLKASSDIRRKLRVLTYEYGVYRPSQNSIMNSYSDEFNAPSRLAIYKRIMELSGEGYSYGKFIESDAINMSAGTRSEP